MARRYRVAVVLATFVKVGRSIVEGVATYADHARTWELHSAPLPRVDRRIISAALRADGVITWLINSDVAALVRKAKVPVVAVHYKGQTPVPRVCENNVTIAQVAADHFISQGFRHFAFFGAAGRIFSTDRAKYFQQILGRRGFTCDVFYTSRIEPKTYDWHTHDEAVVAWLRSLPRPVGIFAGNDLMAQQVLLNAPHARLRVPDDAAVIGVDNDETVCRVTSPPLSSIDVGAERVGYQAAALLDRLMKGERVPLHTRLIEPDRLVVRQSSDVCAVADRDVADAVRFIRENIARQLNVADVLREIPVSRRTLERAFRKNLSRSIHEEIAESRIRLASQLLSETDMPIPDLAKACGFTNRTHLYSIFQRRTGHSPAAYRREFRPPR